MAIANTAQVPAKIFYSWQSFQPKTNRSFIQACIQKAIRELHKEPELEIKPELDRDTANVPGSPTIDEAIFAKIKEATIFVCDISYIVGRHKYCPKTP